MRITAMRPDPTYPADHHFVRQNLAQWAFDEARKVIGRVDLSALHDDRQDALIKIWALFFARVFTIRKRVNELLPTKIPAHRTSKIFFSLLDFYAIYLAGFAILTSVLFTKMWRR